MGVELLTGPEEFEQNSEHEKVEIEKKYRLLNPDFFDNLRQEIDTQQIVQVYLSRPDEPYSLRLRKTTDQNGVSFTATLKDRGVVTPAGLRRTETPTVIDEAIFNAYASGDYPIIYKERVNPVLGVSIDWVDGDNNGPILEIEDLDNNEEAALFYEIYQDQLIDRSGDEDTSNEYLAHLQKGIDTAEPGKLPIETGDIAREILAYRRAGQKQLVVTIAGRSGSGKTTSVKGLERFFANIGISVVTLSADDYHRGKTFLEASYSRPWTDWDAPIVYDTKTLAFDIWRLKNGESIERRRFDFKTQEPTVEGVVAPQDVILIEGIHAGSADLNIVRQLHFEIDTPLATSIGRDLARIRSGQRSNDSIGSTEARLRYQLEVAEPTYQKINKPERNRWSGCVRPIGETALSQIINQKTTG